MRGQASIEALLVFAGVIMILAALLPMGLRDNEVDIAIAAARSGGENAIAGLVLKYGDDMDIRGWDIHGDNITLYLSVQGPPPPDNQTIENAVRENALDQISQAGIGGYSVSVVVKRVKR